MHTAVLIVIRTLHLLKVFFINWPSRSLLICSRAKGAVAERASSALRVVGSIPARNKYLYDLYLVAPGLAVCVCKFKYF